MYLTFHYLQSFLCLQSGIIDMTLLSSLLLLLNSVIPNREIAQLAIKNMVSLRARTKIWIPLSQLSWNPDSFLTLETKIIIAVCRWVKSKKKNSNNYLPFWGAFSVTIKCGTVIWSDIWLVRNTFFVFALNCPGPLSHADPTAQSV